MTQAKTYQISDIDGRNARRITAAQLRAVLGARAAYARRVMAAFRANDLEGCAKAQADMRKRFAN